MAKISLSSHDTAFVTGTVEGDDNPAESPDTVDFSAATGPVVIDLGAARFAEMERVFGNGADTILIGPHADATWTLTGADFGAVNSTSFSNVAHLAGRDAADTFTFIGGASLSGDLAGGLGIDQMDFSGATGPVTVVIEGVDATGFNGSGTVMFAGIDGVIGSPANTDVLDGSQLQGAVMTDTTFSAGDQTLTYTSFETVASFDTVVGLRFGPVDDTTPLDLTLRFIPATQTAELIDTLTQARVGAVVVNALAHQSVQVEGTAGNNILRIDPSASSVGLFVDFHARGGVDALFLSAYPDPNHRAADRRGHRWLPRGQWRWVERHGACGV